MSCGTFQKYSEWKFSELTSCVFVLSIAMFLLTPRYYEVGTETWKVWVAASILSETGRFADITMGPLYYVYLLLFKNLDYPLSVDLEYVVTHLFCYASLHVLLRNFLPLWCSLLLICAWVPIISPIESTRYVAGMSFLSLHFAVSGRGLYGKGVSPPFLVMAILCHWGYLFFGIGHVLGFLATKLRRAADIPTSRYTKSQEAVCLSIKFLLALLVFLVVAFPSARADNNAFMIDYKYLPIPLKSYSDIYFFQHGNWKYVQRHYPKDAWLQQDWYFTHREAFDGAQTILEAIRKKPQVVLENVSTNAIPVLLIPARYILGTAASKELPLSVVWFLVATVIFALGIAGYFETLWKARDFPALLSIILGSSALLSFFLLASTSQRHSLSLLPIGLLALVNVDKGLIFFRWTWWPVVASSERATHEVPAERIEPRSVKLALVCFGAAAAFIITAVSSSHYPTSFLSHAKAVIRGDGWLIGTSEGRADVVILKRSYGKLLSLLNREDKVLALESTWLKSFAGINLDNVFDAFTLPPFKVEDDSQGKFFESLDYIFVSYDWVRPVASISTQGYLRYQLSVEPFLEKSLKNNEWTVEEVPYYGWVYKNNRKLEHRTSARA